MDQSSLNADEYSHHSGKMVRMQARALFGFAVILSLTCLIVSIWVLDHIYIGQAGIKGKVPDSNYVGWSLVLSTLFILLATVAMKVGRVSDDFF